MYLSILEAREGILVIHQWRDASDVVGPRYFDPMCTAIQELDRAAGKLGSPKVHLFIAEPHAPHPDSRARTRLAEIATNLRSRTEFALMTTSGIARATFTLMDLVIPSNPRKRNIAIGSLPAAYAHFEACRPGARALLVDMVRRLDQMYAREVSKTPAAGVLANESQDARRLISRPVPSRP